MKLREASDDYIGWLWESYRLPCPALKLVVSAGKGVGGWKSLESPFRQGRRVVLLFLPQVRKVYEQKRLSTLETFNRSENLVKIFFPTSPIVRYEVRF